MWNNLVSQATDMAKQAATAATEAAQQASEVIQNETEKLRNPDEETKEAITKAESNAPPPADPMNGSCPVAGGDNNETTQNATENNTAENNQNISNIHENITKEVDQMADKIFSFASSWGAKAAAAATQVQAATLQATSQATVIATDLTNKTNAKIQEIQQTELAKNLTEKTLTATKLVTDTIENKTIIGDFNKHQKKQMTMNAEINNREKGCPWEGYEEGEILKTQILNLSTDRRTFVRNPPAGVNFTFDYQKSSKQAIAVLKEDKNLQKMRFELVPKKLKEAVFWRNYFYRVSLIKQSFNLKRLSSSKSSLNNSENDTTSLNKQSSKTSNKSQNNTTQNNTNQKDQEDNNSQDPGDEMFISTEFGENNEISADDLQAEMAALGMDGENVEEGSGEVDEDWEKQLAAELGEYEMVEETGENNAELEKEINDMLN